MKALKSLGFVWLILGFAIYFGITQILNVVPAFDADPLMKEIVNFVLFLIIACACIWLYARGRENKAVEPEPVETKPAKRQVVVSKKKKRRKRRK